MSADLQGIIKRIKGLQANATGFTELGNLQLAEQYAAKMQDLLYEHRLSLSDIELEDLNNSEPIEQEYFVDPDTGDKRQRVVWQARLAQALAVAYNCDTVTVVGTNKLILVGRKSDREIMTHLLVVLSRALRNEADNRLFLFQWGKTGSNSFLNGAVDGIIHQLQERKKKAESEAGSKALVLFDKAAQEYVKKNIQTKNVTTTTTQHHRAARKQGFDYGSSMPINDAVKGQSSNRKLLGE
jgi:hypothetical protein